MCRQVALFRALIRAFAILLENSGHLLPSGEPVFSHVCGALIERFALILRQAVHAFIFTTVFFTHVCKCTRRRRAAEFPRAEFAKLRRERDEPLRLEKATAGRKIEITEQTRLLERFSPEFRERHIEAPHTHSLVAVGAIMRATVARLADFPHLPFETDVPDVRVAPVLPYRYLIFYSVHDDSLVIRNVRHTTRKWSPLGRAA